MEPFTVQDTGHSIQIRDCPEKFGTVGNPTYDAPVMKSKAEELSCIVFWCKPQGNTKQIRRLGKLMTISLTTALIFKGQLQQILEQ